MWVGASIALAVAAGCPRAAAAQPDLQALRASFARYDLREGGTLATLQALGQVDAAAGSQARDEVGYLRIAVASDLAMLALDAGDAVLASRVAAALGWPADELLPRLDAELAQLSRGRFRAPALEAQEVLSRLREPQSAAWREPERASAAKRDLLYLRAVLARIARPDALAELALLASDPCGARCQAPYAAFDGRGRRAVAALAGAGRALDRLRQAAADGDPFARVLAGRLVDIENQLRQVALRPMPGVEKVASVGGPEPGPARAPDAVLFTGTDGVRLGFVPRVQLGVDNRIALRADGQPVLPATEALPLPHKLSPYYLVPLPGVVKPLREALARDAQLQVAVAAAPGSDVDLLARVLVSARRVGCEQLGLLARDAQGATSAVQLALLSKLEADQVVRAALEVRVRPGSYTLRLNGREIDPAQLDAERASRPRTAADVSFVPQISADVLADAVFHVAPSAASMRVLLPASALDISSEFKRSLRERSRRLQGS